MFGRMVDGTTGKANEAANRRVVDDGAAALPAHLQQLIFQAVPHAAQVDCIHPLELFAAGIGCLNCRVLNPGLFCRRMGSIE